MEKKRKILVRSFSSIVFLSLTVGALQGANPESGNGLDTPKILSEAMQAAFRKTVSSESAGQIEQVLDSMPESERIATLLTLYLQTKSNNIKARPAIANLAFSQISKYQGIQRRHLLLLVKAYIMTVDDPERLAPIRLRGGRDNFPDDAIRYIILDWVAYFLDVQSEKKSIIYPGHTEKEWLSQLLSLAQQKSSDVVLTSQIQACQELLKH